MCDVGFVFARRSVGVLWPQSDLFRHTCGKWGKRGPSTGVRISAKRQKSPLVLSPEQVKLGLAELEFRDQLLVFLEGPWEFVKANSERSAGWSATSRT
jgi:hypothetical protein